MNVSFQDDFVNKNRKDIPNALRLMIQKSTALFQMSDIESKAARSLKTSASTLKFEVDSLIKNLEKTVSEIFKQIRLTKIN